jgi:hypothetical protein
MKKFQSKLTQPKLTLNRETLRHLETGELLAIAGGGPISGPQCSIDQCQLSDRC